MTARITSPQSRQVQKLVGDALTALNPTKDGMQRVLAQGDVLQKRLKELIIQLAGEHYVLLTDDEALAWIKRCAKKSIAEAWQIVDGFRKQARARGVADTVKIHSEVHPGCLFKRDIPQMGPCWKRFEYLQDWVFEDAATEHALVSWIPVLLAESKYKNVKEQMAMVAAFKATAKLPAWYSVSFGSVNHLAGMSLAYFNWVGKVPLVESMARTDTCDSDSFQFVLDWVEGSLYCDDCWGESRHYNIGVFVVGVLKALGR